MGTCRCPGGKTVKFTPGKPKKQGVKKASISKGSGTGVKKGGKPPSKQGVRKAGGCTCTQ